MPSVTNHSRYLSSHLDATRGGAAVMKKRALGSTGIIVGEIGLGTAQLGGENLPDHEAVFAMGGALDMEASLIDVAPTYGRALLRLGRAMDGRRQQAQVCLKVGYNADGSFDYSPRGLRRSLEQSLKTLGTDHVEVLLLHDPGLERLQAADPAWAELAKLKAEGKTRAFGATVTTTDEAKAALDKTPARVLQLPFNIFCQDHIPSIAAAAAKRVGVIVNRPLDSGWLSGRYGAHHVFLDARRRWSLAQRARRAGLQDQFEAIVASPTGRPVQSALQFVLSFSGISCAIPGAGGWQQICGNVGGGQAGMDPGVTAKLKDLWERQLKAAPLGL